MTLEEIYRKHGIGVKFLYCNDPYYIYKIVGRWKYGILHTNNHSSKIYKLRFDQSIHDYNIYYKNKNCL